MKKHHIHVLKPFDGKWFAVDLATGAVRRLIDPAKSPAVLVAKPDRKTVEGWSKWSTSFGALANGDWYHNPSESNVYLKSMTNGGSGWKFNMVLIWNWEGKYGDWSGEQTNMAPTVHRIDK